MEQYDPKTMNKVYEALKRAGLPHRQAICAINEMRDSGIRFVHRDIPDVKKISLERIASGYPPLEWNQKARLYFGLRQPERDE